MTFNAFDHAGDGFIDADKLKSVLSNLGLQFQVNVQYNSKKFYGFRGSIFLMNDGVQPLARNLKLLSENSNKNMVQDTDIQNIIHQVGSEGRISFDDFQRFMLNSDDII